MPGMSGIELLDELGRRGTHPPVIVLTGSGDMEIAVRAMKLGAFDFLEKPVRDSRLRETITEAIERDRRQRGNEVQQSNVKDRVARLTPREREVMDLALDGKTNKVIAAKLGLSPRTVQTYRSRVRAKMRLLRSR